MARLALLQRIHYLYSLFFTLISLEMNTEEAIDKDTTFKIIMEEERKRRLSVVPCYFR